MENSKIMETSSPGNTLFRLIEQLHVPFGYERSFKMMEGELLDERYLLSLHKRTLGEHPLQRIRRICAALNFPDEFQTELENLLPEADLIHLGFEGGRQETVCKLYLEFARRLRQQIQTAGENHVKLLVHHAFKWDPDNAAKRIITKYYYHTRLTLEDMYDKLAQICNTWNVTPLLHIVRQIVSSASTRMADEDIFFLEVEEENNPRHSFDINIYDAELTLGEIQSLLWQAGKHFLLTDDRLNRLIHCVEQAAGAYFRR